MNRTEFEEQKTGVTTPDAGVDDQDTTNDDVTNDLDNEMTNSTADDDSLDTEPTDNDLVDDDSDNELPELPEEQKTAFQKRLEREQKKIREAAEKELSEKYETQYGKHKSIVDMLGGDPDKVEQMIRDNQAEAAAQQQAQSLANQYGWDEQQTQQYAQQYAQQQKKDQELADLKVQVQINEFKDNPDYAGIGNMKKEIQTMIGRSNNALSVEQAYWALGGKNRAEQLKREAEQREIAKRSKTKRTVQSDSPTSTTGEKPLSAEDERLRQKMGISITEARNLLKDSPSNLEQFRKQKK